MGRERVLCGVVTVKGDYSVGDKVREILKDRYETDITITNDISERTVEIKVYTINEGGK